MDQVCATGSIGLMTLMNTLIIHYVCVTGSIGLIAYITISIAIRYLCSIRLIDRQTDLFDINLAKIKVYKYNNEGQETLTKK